MPLSTIDTNMLRLADLLKEAGIIRFKGEFYETLGMKRQNIYEVKKGIRGFTVEQIECACRAYHVRPDWIFGFTDKVFIRAAKATHS